MKNIFVIATLILVMASCDRSSSKYDASGAFEATEIIISSKAMGTIEQLNIEEGQTLDTGEVVGYIDSTQLVLKREQLLAMKGAIKSKNPDVKTQLAAMDAQLEHAKNEQVRLMRLVKADAATQKQLDDANAQINVLSKQIEAQKSVLDVTKRSLVGEEAPIEVQVEQINNQINDCAIKNSVVGTVLTKYAEAQEITSIGKPLYKIADMREMTLRAYIVGGQLSQLKIGQLVKVRIDAADDKYKEYDGVVEWISEKAEFTPKTIQTKSERENLVYAIKIKVKNDGYLKIGMYGEVIFSK